MEFMPLCLLCNINTWREITGFTGRLVGLKPDIDLSGARCDGTGPFDGGVMWGFGGNENEAVSDGKERTARLN